MVQRFLEDRSEALWADLRARFQSGGLRLTEETEFRGRLNEIEDFLGLDWPSVTAFYGIAEENTLGTEIPEDDGA